MRGRQTEQAVLATSPGLVSPACSCSQVFLSSQAELAAAQPAALGIYTATRQRIANKAAGLHPVPGQQERGGLSAGDNRGLGRGPADQGPHLHHPVPQRCGAGGVLSTPAGAGLYNWGYIITPTVTVRTGWQPGAAGRGRGGGRVQQGRRPQRPPALHRPGQHRAVVPQGGLGAGRLDAHAQLWFTY